MATGPRIPVQTGTTYTGVTKKHTVGGLAMHNCGMQATGEIVRKLRVQRGIVVVLESHSIFHLEVNQTFAMDFSARASDAGDASLITSNRGQSVLHVARPTKRHLF
mmetsp:Transcript_44409/g.78102  ORF Transcript_44409/g.78102 Transcript_44409/m.78102 type:complete len:106 (-) Transcript_44409:1685-2002(-)